MAFVTHVASRVTSTSVSSSSVSPSSPSLCSFCRIGIAKRSYRTASMTLSNADEQKSQPHEGEEDKALEAERARMLAMRERLEGLFGAAEPEAGKTAVEAFDGLALRSAIVRRWGVQYDIQPTKFAGRVYVQVMWRYFEQQSFYMDEEEFSSHCEAMAILLKRWDAVDYFLEYIANIRKKPVVGITINIPIPGLNAAETPFEV